MREAEVLKATATPLKYVSVGVISQYWWCDLQAVLWARSREREYKERYEYDLRYYAAVLGKSGPFTLDDMEVVLAGRKAPTRKSLQVSRGKLLGLKESWRDGVVLEAEYKELYPSVCWEFDVSPYLLVGIPDGITSEFVYEFKTIAREYSIRLAGGPAEVQAHLYGWLFNRPNIRLQLYLKDTGEIKTIEKPTDVERAKGTFKHFADLEQGLVAPYRTKVKWKCDYCDYKERCEKV